MYTYSTVSETFGVIKGITYKTLPILDFSQVNGAVSGKDYLKVCLSHLRSITDDNLLLLKSFVCWLDMLNNSEMPHVLRSKTTGKLYYKTHNALRHTSHTFALLSEYLLAKLKFEFALLERFQTDALEDRFGQYRGMSGGNYPINVN